MLFPREHDHFLRRSLGLASVLLCLAAASGAGPAVAPAAAATASDPGSLEAELYNLVEHDRWQQGERGLVLNPTLAGLARGAPHQSCGGGQVFHGRAQDMVERSYFSHTLPPCAALIFPAIQVAGLPFAAAAENIAWAQGSGLASPGLVNSGFMASPEHRANILGAYNSVGVGAWLAPGVWTGGGGARTGVILFAVIFAHVPGVVGPAAAPPPPPPVAALPAPAPRPAAVEVAAPAPEPSPTSQALGDHDGVTLAAPLADMRPPTVEGAAVGPAFLRRVGFLFLVVVLPLALLVATLCWWRKRRLPWPDGGP